MVNRRLWLFAETADRGKSKGSASSYAIPVPGNLMEKSEVDLHQWMIRIKLYEAVMDIK